jgi:hypothetical protein
VCGPALSFTTLVNVQRLHSVQSGLPAKASLNQQLRTNYPGRDLASGYPQMALASQKTQPLNMAGPFDGRYNQVPINNLQNDPAQLNRI